MLKQAQNDPRMKETESMSIPVIGGGGAWGNNIPGIEEDPMVSHAAYQLDYELEFSITLESRERMIYR